MARGVCCRVQPSPVENLICAVGQGRLHAAPVCGAGEVEGGLLPIHCVLEQRMAACSLSGIAISVQNLFPIRGAEWAKSEPHFSVFSAAQLHRRSRLFCRLEVKNYCKSGSCLQPNCHSLR